MKILKILLVLIAIIAIAFIVLMQTGAKDYKVSRSLVINANDSIVFEHIHKFQNWDAWSPWKEMDPTAHYSIAGNDGTVGAEHSWSGGNPEITGTGSMKMTEVVPRSKVQYDLHFTKPQEMSSVGGFELEPAGENKTKLTWYDQGDIPAMQRPFMIFFDLEEMIGSSFERGLFKIDSLATISQNAMSATAEATE
jgi:hypothetical protein